MSLIEIIAYRKFQTFSCVQPVDNDVGFSCPTFDTKKHVVGFQFKVTSRSLVSLQ